MLLVLFGAASADPSPTPAAAPADAVKDLEAKYHTERAAADALGLTKQFSPDWYQRAAAYAKAGDDALTAGRLVEAADAFRKARWHLPAPPAGVPDHVARFFGDGRLRLGDMVEAVAFSPDGQRVVSAGKDGAVVVWDAAPATRFAATPPCRQVSAVAFSPDGKTVASGGEDKVVKIWDADTGKEVKSLTRSTDFLWRLAFSPDGKYLATGGNDKHLRVYDLSNDTVKWDRSGQNQKINGIAWSRDGKRIATVDAARSLTSGMRTAPTSTSGSPITTSMATGGR